MGDSVDAILRALLYDMARAHVAKGLAAGGVRILWNQFPTGPFVPLPYLAFSQIFLHGWKFYKPWSPPITLLNRPEAKARKVKCLTYEYAESHNVFYLF